MSHHQRNISLTAQPHPQAQGYPNQSMRSDRSLVSSGWITTNASSWASTRGLSGTIGPDRPPLAWVGVRHQVREEGEIRGVGGVVGEDETRSGGAGHCSQAVLITCLHLSHEMGLRDVGQYAWTTPMIKDPMGSMMKIMKQYSQQVRGLSKHSTLDCRTAPDPSKLVIQHHLQRARQQAAQNNYVAVIYNGHGIQEPPTEQGELWCYDRGFDECLQNGGGPSEYIPIMLFDVLAWAGSSTCYVWDVSFSGRFIKAAQIEAEEIDNQYKSAAAQNPQIAEIHPAVYARRQIHFASCGPNQTIPRINGMPDDLFTACLTNPLRIALLYHNLQTFPLTKGDGSSYIPKHSEYMVLLWENMSITLKDRLSYELLSIIHTIAWQTLNGMEYQKLFGKSGDLVNNLSSGFILSQRVLSSYRVNPESIPTIPSSTGHTLWTTWDLILDNLFEQLPKYFDEGNIDHSWGKNLKLVSFMQDQLESITTATTTTYINVDDSTENGSGTWMTPSLSRLPIICAAAMTKQFRHQACQALDSCLRVLDIRGLSHAVQGGALDVAAKLLAQEDPEIKNALISIWSSLVRYDTAVLALAREGLTSERLTDVPSVKFFLDAMKENLVKDVVEENILEEEERISLIIQTAAVLSTIANFVSGRQAPRFVLKTLSMSGIMLKADRELMKQWGALLIAEVLGSLDQPNEQVDLGQDRGLIEGLKGDLIQMVGSGMVETRATAIYALARWIPSSERGKERERLEAELKPSLEIVEILLKHSDDEGSPLVRRELARLFIRIVEVADGYRDLAIWISILQSGLKVVESLKEEVEQAIVDVGRDLGITEDQLGMMKVLQRVYEATKRFGDDPDLQVQKIVSRPLEGIMKSLCKKGDKEDEKWKVVSKLVLGNEESGSQWTEDLLRTAMSANDRILEKWRRFDRAKGDMPERKDQDKIRLEKKLNNELFDRTKLVLQSYLAAGRRPDPMPDKVMTSQGGSSRERTWTMRHRVLEDSLVVAEQQVGLPWKWAIKDISTPDPWTNMTFHSFHSTVMSCNRSHDLLLWDWSTSRKTGHVHLNLPQSSAITSARFVNELHEQIVILAEITNGDVHILAGPQDPSMIKPISNFRALDLTSSRINTDVEYPRRLITTWYRSSGLLCVGGYSDKINVWDCPAERCVQSLETESTVPITTLITEPVSGNLIFAGLSNGQIKLYDLRQSRKKALISWRGDCFNASSQSEGASDIGKSTSTDKAMLKIGVVLGESKNISSACANGMINTYDLRALSSPIQSILSHPNGISYASFQAHSGLLSTISNLHPPAINPNSEIVTDLSNLTLSSGRPSATFSLHRTSLGSLTSVTSELISFGAQSPETLNSKYYRPYTVIHPLRPFLGIGFGHTYSLRGCGVGKGDDTDSGSYSFIRAQATNMI
ncbi:hypothetical protein I302_105996 [Kwoniella bestiolae CBS 10118]|uniref:Raptor N-terminal CASPase-like domain-containing protein n=1 Tax=Kwoniella bestiolae CBS 10118 TaxID=1296100 RepID=A0A1B9G2R2_9TREE|nr:hypothetical protein I302_05120 [Kwoniella bestiolae CBS 10118]OCF25306.1 hypothetical protein I302_05120 [Kwoniella bestiolae CBS 10118]